MTPERGAFSHWETMRSGGALAFDRFDTRLRKVRGLIELDDQLRPTCPHCQSQRTHPARAVDGRATYFCTLCHKDFFPPFPVAGLEGE